MKSQFYWKSTDSWTPDILFSLGKRCVHPALHNPNDVKTDIVDLNQKNKSRSRLLGSGSTFLKLL
jgi:hypothetical protein